MGTVYKVHDPLLGREVALKVVTRPEAVSEGALARFVTEARVTAQLQHPNVVPVHEMGVTDDGRVWFVMKEVEGRSLRQVIDAIRARDEATLEAWPPHRLLGAFVQVCHAVAYANDRGVLHCDLKPGNVMVGAFGEVLVVDWGVARLQSEVATREPIRRPVTRDRETNPATLDGAVVGTPGYMSPEQARGDLELLGPRTDVFGLGGILYSLLTLRPPYEGDGVVAVTFAAASGPPMDPRDRATERGIHREIAAICLRAMSTEAEDRWPDAGSLGSAVEAFLQGRRQQDRAREHGLAAAAAWQEHLALDVESSELSSRIDELERQIEPWAPLEDKVPLLRSQERRADLEVASAVAFGRAIAEAERALSQDPRDRKARLLLAVAYWSRCRAAEERGDRAERSYYEARVREYDDERRTPLFQTTGTLHLRSDPPAAEVWCERVHPRGLVWSRVEHRLLGRTPLAEVELQIGSYILTLTAPGRLSTTCPVRIDRGERWDGEVPVRLPAEDSLGPEWAWIPAGPYLRGGDLQAQDSGERRSTWVDGFALRRLPVTMAEYCTFINALHERDPDLAWSRVPRQESRMDGSSGQYWERPGVGGRYVIPAVDREGDPWDPTWPVGAVTWHDACAFAAWRAEVEGKPIRLPIEDEMEKAARGVDGRAFPWGDRFDPTLAKMRHSAPGRPQPAPVGTYATDCSVYGVRDLAGSMREWCGDPDYDGDTERRPVRGGSWVAIEEVCRAAYRNGFAPWLVSSNFSFRLAMTLP